MYFIIETFQTGYDRENTHTKIVPLSYTQNICVSLKDYLFDQQKHYSDWFKMETERTGSSSSVRQSKDLMEFMQEHIDDFCKKSLQSYSVGEMISCVNEMLKGIEHFFFHQSFFRLNYDEPRLKRVGVIKGVWIEPEEY
jgi:hypothetical protein